MCVKKYDLMSCYVNHHKGFVGKNMHCKYLQGEGMRRTTPFTPITEIYHMEIHDV